MTPKEFKRRVRRLTARMRRQYPEAEFERVISRMEQAIEREIDTAWGVLRRVRRDQARTGGAS